MIKIVKEIELEMAKLAKETAKTNKQLLKEINKVLFNQVIKANKETSAIDKIWSKSLIDNVIAEDSQKENKDKDNNNQKSVDKKETTTKKLSTLVIKEFKELKKINQQSLHLNKVRQRAIKIKEIKLTQELNEKKELINQNITKVNADFGNLKDSFSGKNNDKPQFTKDNTKLAKLWKHADKMQKSGKTQQEKWKKPVEWLKKEVEIAQQGQAGVLVNNTETSNEKKSSQTNTLNSKQQDKKLTEKKENSSEVSSAESKEEKKTIYSVLMNTDAAKVFQNSGQEMKTQFISQLLPVVNKYNEFNSEFQAEYKKATDAINQQMTAISNKVNEKIVETSVKLTGALSNKLTELTEKYPKTTKAAVYLGAGVIQANKVIGEAKVLYGDVIKRGINVISFFTSKTVAVGADTAATAANTGVEQVQYITKYQSMILTIKSTISTIQETVVLKAKLFALKAQAFATKLATGAQFALNAVMSANPIALAVIGITALGAGLIIAYKKSEKFRAIVHKVWHSIKGFWKVLMKNPIKTVAATLANLTNPIGLVLKGLGKVYKIWQKLNGKKSKKELKAEISSEKTEKKTRKKKKRREAQLRESNYNKYSSSTLNTRENVQIAQKSSSNSISENSSKFSDTKEQSLLEKAGTSLANSENREINTNKNTVANNSEGSIVIQNLEINVTGKNSQEIKEAVEQGADELMRKLEELSKRIAVKEKRLSYV